MLATDLAYLAGMIDGDGHITIRRVQKTNKGRAKPAVYHELVVGITGTRREPHDFAASLFGGSVNMYKGKHLPVFIWHTGGPRAASVAVAVSPYLRIKQAHAGLAVEFQKLLDLHRVQQRLLKPPYRVTDEMRAERDALWSRMTVLNQPGNRRRWKTDAAGRLLDGVQHDGFPEVPRG